MKMLLAASAEVHAETAKGNTPLYFAALKGHEAIFKELLAAMT